MVQIAKNASLELQSENGNPPSHSTRRTFVKSKEKNQRPTSHASSTCRKFVQPSKLSGSSKTQDNHYKRKLPDYFK